MQLKGIVEGLHRSVMSIRKQVGCVLGERHRPRFMELNKINVESYRLPIAIGIIRRPTTAATEGRRYQLGVHLIYLHKSWAKGLTIKL